MKARSILVTFWPLLKILQILGSCPFKKDKTSLCGFEAISSCAYFSIVISVWFVAVSGVIICLSFLFFIHGVNPSALMKYSFDINGSTMGSTMDMICISGMSGAMLLVAITIYIGNFKLKNRIIDLLNLFENLDLPSEESGRKYFMKSVILSWFCVMFGILGIPSLFGHDESELDFLSITVVSFIYLILQAVQLSPIIGFLIFYSACCSELNRWIGLLIEKFESKLDYEEKETIQDCSRLIKEGLKKTNATFSCPLFWISSLYLTVLIICAYFATNFLSKVSLFTYKIVIIHLLIQRELNSLVLSGLYYVSLLSYNKKSLKASSV